MKKLYLLLAVLIVLSGCTEVDNVDTKARFEKDAKIDKSNDTAPHYVSPLDRPQERISKKTFGIKIDPSSSPVQPERFSGYHTGVDFEIFSEEINNTINVKTFCDGKILSKRAASGYGGIVVQLCKIDNQSVTAIYGHLDITSVTASINDNIKKGEVLGVLGNDKSSQTDGERKHLHFGLHKGGDTNIKGYVQSEEELENWLDPLEYLK